MSVELAPRPQNLPAAPAIVAHPVPAPAPGRREAPLKGRKKAAVLLVSLGPERAADIFRHMREEEIESLSLEMAKLQRIDPTVTDNVLNELAATVEDHESLMAGGVEYARDVLERALGRIARTRSSAGSRP